MEESACCMPGPSYDEAKLKELNIATRPVLEEYVRHSFDRKIPVSAATVSFDCRVLDFEHFEECENDVLGNLKHMALTEHIPRYSREHLAFGMGITPEHYSVFVDYRRIDSIVFRAPLELELGDVVRAHVFTGENSIITCPVPRGYCVNPKSFDELEGIVRAYRIDVLSDKKFFGVFPRKVERSYEDEEYMLGIGLKE